MSFKNKLATSEGYREFFTGFHANRNRKAPPLETPLVSQREKVVTPIGNHVWRVM